MSSARNHTRVQASFAAAELSRDFDWIRVRASGLYASGDSDPFDKTAHGFDGLSQSALFAGADSSFFIHQQLPLALSQINLKVRDSLFPDLRSSAAPGESNYENPGLAPGRAGRGLRFLTGPAAVVRRQSPVVRPDGDAGRRARQEPTGQGHRHRPVVRPVLPSPGFAERHPASDRRAAADRPGHPTAHGR